MDRDDDLVTVRIEAGNSALKKCENCMDLDLNSNGIVFMLTEEFQSELSTIYVYLSDTIDERQYFFYLTGSEFDGVIVPIELIEPPRLEI